MAYTEYEKKEISDNYFLKKIELPDEPDYIVYDDGKWLGATSVHATCFLGSFLDVIIDNGNEIVFEGTRHECLGYMYENRSKYFILT